jgi:hypothetical protein
MDDTKFESSDQSPRCGRQVRYSESTYFLDISIVNASRKLRWPGVGGTPPSFKQYGVVLAILSKLLVKSFTKRGLWQQSLGVTLAEHPSTILILLRLIHKVDKLNRRSPSFF